MTTQQITTYCRLCINYCPIVATVKDGRVTRIVGDKANPVWKGHTCVKGRAQHKRTYSADRLLHSQKRRPDGTYEPISSEQAMDEIAARIQALIGDHGLRSVAYYTGSGTLSHVLMHPVAAAFLDALKLPLIYTPVGIDKPGRPLAKAMHGNWMAPHQGYKDPDVALLVGANPLISYEGAPLGNPSWLADRVAAGMELIVLDPRKTETARRATIHIRPRPGTDGAILASFLHVILEEGLLDHDFVDRHVEGVEALKRAVAAFTPGAVAKFADVESEVIVAAARAFGRVKRGYAFAGTGASMSDPGPLTDYLILCLDTLCGHWLREGEKVTDAPVLFPVPEYIAQASPPKAARFDDTIYARGLPRTVCGPPVAALADEILTEGEGRIRGLISCGGNPVGAFPGRAKVIKAMRELELLVQIDFYMSQTAQLADYVIAPLLALETPDISHWQDFFGFHGAGFGNTVAHGQYAPKVIDPPEGSDLIADWEFFYGLAHRMGLPLRVTESCFGYYGIEPFDVDMERKPTTDELLEKLASRSRIPLDEVKRNPHGAVYEPEVYVKAGDPEWPHRLDVGNADMMAELKARGAKLSGARTNASGRDFVLLNRRSRELYNTNINDGESTGGRRYNPVHLNPADLDELGVEEGTILEIESAHGSVLAIAAGDTTLPRGLVTLTHGYGDIDTFGEPLDSDPRNGGAAVNDLIPNDVDFDPYSGMPRLSNIPVAIRPRQVRHVETKRRHDEH